MNVGRSALAPLLWVGLAGCWSQPVAMPRDEIRPPVEPQNPQPEPVVDAGPGAGPTGARASQPVDPGVAFATYAPAPTQRRLLPSGLVLATPASAHGGRIAVVRLALPFGQRMGKAGLADLAVHAVAEARVGDGAGRTLRDAIVLLGGQIEVELGAQASAIELTVPTAQWRPALALLVAALRAEALGDAACSELRERLVRRRAEERARPRAGTLALGITRWPELPPSEHLARLQSLEADEVAVFQRLQMQPRGCVLALHVPGEEGIVVASQAELTLAPWLDAAPQADPPKELAPVVPLPGLRIAQAPFAEIGLVLTLPTLEEPLALELRLLLEILSMEGIGGRIGLLLREAGAGPVAFEGTLHDEPGGSYLWLRAPAPPSAFAAIWRGLDLARESLRLRPPNDDEVRRAAQRLQLRLVADHEDPRAWARHMCAQVLRAAVPERSKPFDLGELLNRLGEPKRLQLAAALAQFGRNPLSAVAVAPELPPLDLPGVTVVDEAFATGVSGVVPADRTAQAERAKPFIEQALRAVGGPEALATLGGYAAELHLGETDTLLRDLLWVRAPDRMRRMRRVLATTIETVATRDGGSERAGDQELPLAPEESIPLLERALRHPLLLLAAVARGEASYRLIALRRAGNRPIAVLERDDPTQERLRLLVDAESGLVRGLETREARPGLGRVNVREEFADYRTVGALRTPFLVTTVLDDRIRVVAKWVSVTFGAPGDAELGVR